MRREIEFVKSALLQQVLERSASPMKAYRIGERMNHVRLSRCLCLSSIMQSTTHARLNYILFFKLNALYYCAFDPHYFD
jgi:hypothetical protein